MRVWWTQPLVWLFAGLSNRDQAQQLEFARAEIAILRRRLPGPIRVTRGEKQPEERRALYRLRFHEDVDPQVLPALIRYHRGILY